MIGAARARLLALPEKRDCAQDRATRQDCGGDGRWAKKRAVNESPHGIGRQTGLPCRNSPADAATGRAVGATPTRPHGMS